MLKCIFESNRLRIGNRSRLIMDYCNADVYFRSIGAASLGQFVQLKGGFTVSLFTVG